MPSWQGVVLDPTGRVIDGLAAGYQRINDLLPGLIAQSSALAAMDVSDQGRRDLLNFAFERCIESFGWIVDSVMKVRQAIVAHDQTAEPKSEESADAEAASIESLESNAA